jgi:long-chain acyl-CoA synthetase
LRLLCFKMFRSKTPYTALSQTGTVPLGQTLPSLLDEVCDRHPNPHALQQWVNNAWQSLSNQAFRLASEELALGLLDLSLTKGDRVSLFMHSDVNFCLADMACLLAGCVNVPIDLGLNAEAIQFILKQTESTVLITSNLELLNKIIPCLGEDSSLKTIIVADVSAEALLPNLLPQMPGVQVVTLASVKARGQAQWSDQTQQQLQGAIDPSDTATIVYTSSANGQPKGVMLSHESLAGDMLSSFSAFPELQPGLPEVALLFLPLTHVFARVFLYGHLYYSHRVYFTTPNWVSKHLREVRPTVFITVPRLLEKAHEKILEQGGQLRGIRRWFFNWAMHLAKRYELGRSPRGFYALQLWMNRLVFSQWRAGFGGRVKYLISGGAALQADLANVLAAAGMPIFQGYGLTESSSALCSNRRDLNRAGTVGVPIAGVKIAIAPDGEILAKTPYKMQGYYKDPDATRKAIDRDGWLHTGDLGEFTAEGFLKITGHKKPLFKLSTGHYVSPQPIEQQLKRSPFVKQAIVIGTHRKFCTLLIFPDLDYLCPQAEGMCLALPLEKMLKHSKITALYQALIDEANQHLPYWSTIKRFRLIHLTLALEEGEEKPALTIKRDRADQLFAAEVETMYREKRRENGRRTQWDKLKKRAASQIPQGSPQVQPVPQVQPAKEDQPTLIPVPIRFLQTLNSRFTTLRAGGDSNHV